MGLRRELRTVGFKLLRLAVPAFLVGLSGLLVEACGTGSAGGSGDAAAEGGSDSAACGAPGESCCNGTSGCNAGLVCGPLGTCCASQSGVCGSDGAATSSSSGSSGGGAGD